MHPLVFPERREPREVLLVMEDVATVVLLNVRHLYSRFGIESEDQVGLLLSRVVAVPERRDLYLNVGPVNRFHQVTGLALQDRAIAVDVLQRPQRSLVND